MKEKINPTKLTPVLSIIQVILVIVLVAGCNLGVPSDNQTPPPPAPTLTPTPAEPAAEAEPYPLPAESEMLLLINGNILTMNPKQPAAQAIAIQGQEIVEVGSNESILRYQKANTRVIDLHGHTLIPGFIDSHSHLFFNTDRNDAGLQQAQDWVLSQGITTITEATTNQKLLEWLAEADAAGKLRIRTALYLMYTNACGEVAGAWFQDHPSAHLNGEYLRVPGIKIFTDGGACNQPAVSFEYSAGGNGNLYFDDEQLSQVIIEAQQMGYQVLLHALGDRGAELALNAVEMALNGAPNTYRHRIDHNTLIRDEMLPRYGKIGIVPVIFGKFPACFFAGDTSQFKYLTPAEYRDWEWRYGDLIRINPDLIYAWHADYPVFDSINPIEHLYGFVTRQEINPDGILCTPADWAADDRIPVEQALQIMTIHSAYATLFEDITGSLEVGKYADLIILSANPLEIAADELINLEILMTMVGGKVEYCAEGRDALCPLDPQPQSPTPVPSESQQNNTLFASVTTSAPSAETPAQYLVDGDPDTVWNSNGDPLQWVEIVWDEPKTISEIRLDVAQYPSGETEHRIYIKKQNGGYELIYTFTGITEDGNWLIYTLPQPQKDIQVVRVETHRSPSWVAWREIIVFGSGDTQK